MSLGLCVDGRVRSCVGEIGGAAFDICKVRMGSGARREEKSRA